MFQHQAVENRSERPVPPPRSFWLSLPSSQDRKAFSWDLRVTSVRDWVEEAPQALHRHRVRPALVLPFFTSLVAHTPQTGRFRELVTEHAYKACSTLYIGVRSTIPGCSVHTFLPITRVSLWVL